MDIELRPSETMFKIYRDICILKIKSSPSLTDLAIDLNRKPTDKTFHNSIKLLEALGIITMKSTNSYAKQLIIDRPLLIRYVRKNSEEFDKWETFLHKTLLMAVTT